MNRNRSFIIISLILAAVAYLSVSSYLPARFDAAAGTRVENFPKEIGQWQGKEIPIDQRTYEILETTNLFVREYQNPAGEKVYLYLVYSEDNRKVSHPPEVCMLGSGMTVADKSAVQLTDSITATKLEIEYKDSNEMVAYWYKAGDLNTDKYLKQQVKVVLDRLRGKRTSCALVRLSTVIDNNNQEQALDLLKRFTKQIEPLLNSYLI